MLYLPRLPLFSATKRCGLRTVAATPARLSSLTRHVQKRRYNAASACESQKTTPAGHFWLTYGAYQNCQAEHAQLMSFSVKEMFYTLQGEGCHCGRPAVFCRFTGCNLWSGREQDRQRAICQFCDTDFIGIDGQNGGRFKTAAALAERIDDFWPAQMGHKFVVFTGGEPGLQLTSALIDEMHHRHFDCAVESNGTVSLPDNLDWVCISPKGRADVIITQCDELKLVYPQTDAPPERFAHIQAKHRFLSPKNDWREHSLVPGHNPATKQCIDYCLANPQWKLTLQSHKVLNID